MTVTYNYGTEYIVSSITLNVAGCQIEAASLRQPAAFNVIELYRSESLHKHI